MLCLLPMYIYLKHDQYLHNEVNANISSPCRLYCVCSVVNSSRHCISGVAGNCYAYIKMKINCIFNTYTLSLQCYCGCLVYSTFGMLTTLTV